VALCHGWIDGQKATFDENYWLQRFTPRRSRSRWSKINRDKATELIARGEMKPAGLREVERALLVASITSVDTVKRRNHYGRRQH
jgi:uncharacterized protein YdeI (YjbR/CyaY-like superfamily)